MALPPTILDGSVTLTWGAAGQYYGYCSVADVTYEFPQAATQTMLTPSTVAQEISAAGQEMQDQLNLAYVMPYVGADSGILQTLRQINAKLATANLLDRQFQGSENALSATAAEHRSWAELIIMDVLHGVIQWGAPFGDAVARAEQPLYPSAAGATVMPSPNDSDPYTATAVFTMSRALFRRNQTF
jgi:hypothetical protein